MSRILRDPLLLLLLMILAISLLAFMADLLPYPFGLLLLSAFIIARILHIS